MKRSGPPQRHKRLRADPEQTRAWQSRTRRRLPRKSAKRQIADAATAQLRARVAARPCLLARGALLDGVGLLLVGGRCAGPGTPHHLEKAGQGGATDEANLVPLCAFHNGWVEDDPPLARRLGLVVRPGIDHAEAFRRRVAAGLTSAYYALPIHPDQQEPRP